MDNEITEKSKKSDIFVAYNQLLQQVKTLKNTSRREQRQETEKKDIVQQAMKEDPENIVKNIADLKLSTVHMLDNIGEQMIDAYNKLTNIHKSIEIENKNLHEKYEINACADTLDALLLGQEKARNDFEKEMQAKRQAFEQEIQEKRDRLQKQQTQLEIQRNEEIELLKKQRKREQEEYQYQITLQRNKDKDEYEIAKAALERELSEKRAAFEKEMAEREASLKQQENELHTLREKAEAFPQQLQAAIEETKQSTIYELQAKHKFEMELYKKEIEGRQNLSQQTIQMLENKIKDYEARMQHLNQKANQSNLQVQEIALKAIEGASATNYTSFATRLEKSLEKNKVDNSN